MIQLPRLLDKQMQEVARLHPVSLTLDLNMAPLSTAVMTLPEGSAEVQTGAFVELFTSYGSAGIFRVQQASHQFGGTMTLNLEHGIVTLADGIIPGALEEEKTTSARAALVEIIGYQDVWQLGTVEVPEDTTLSWSYDYSNLLESFLSILDNLPAYMVSFDQSKTPWTVNIVAVSDEPASECRLSRNISTLTVETDRSELCTRLYVPGLQAPLESDTIGKWGAVSRSLTADEGLTADELTAYGNRYLEEHKNPALTVSIDAFDLHKATGENMDAFHLGYVCRVCLPDFGQTIDQRIVTLSWPDMVADAENVRLTLASRAETAADTLAGLIVDTTVQRRLIYKNGQELDRLVVRTIANEEQINIITPRLDILALDIQANANAIKLKADQASLDLSNGKIDANAKNISLNADEIEANADAIKANADAISLKADQASLDLANGRIDAQANTIALKADKIDLEGLVTATELETVRASISNLTSGLTTAMIINANTANVDQINGTFGSFDALNHNGALVSQRSITMGSVSSTGKALSTGGELDLQHSHAVTVNDDGTITLGEVSAEGGNFNIADTKVYKDGVSAAKESVTLSAPKGWNGGSYVVEASNGKTHTVRLPEFSSSGGTSFNSSHKTTVYFHTASVSGPLKSVEVDATSVYNSGKTAGYKEGWAAAVAKLGISGNIIKGPSSTVDEQADLYTITAGGSINSVRNTAANYFFAEGYGRAYVNGEQVDYKYISKGQQIGVGQ